jgi:hypothetical protein
MPANLCRAPGKILPTCGVAMGNILPDVWRAAHDA